MTPMAARIVGTMMARRRNERALVRWGVLFYLYLVL